MHEISGNAMISGILFEGLNYVGKTSVIHGVQRLLRDRGEGVVMSHCVLGEEPRLKELDMMAMSSVREDPGSPFPAAEVLSEFNVLKTAQVVLDTVMHAPAAAQDFEMVRLQDRHWFSQYCNNRYFGGDPLFSPDWITESAPAFAMSVWLTCEGDERVRRAARSMRARPHRLNQYLTRHVAELDDFDRQCMRWAEQIGGWVVLDTTKTGADEVAARIVDLYDLSLPEPAAR